MSDVYESRKLLNEYLLFHYGTKEQILPWASGPAEALEFPLRTTAHFSDQHVDRALDVGCAVGRSTLELSRSANEVIGIDFSQAFIDAASEISKSGEAKLERLEEGGQTTELLLKKPEGLEKSRVSFEAGDAMNLRGDLGSFNRVHAANLVCRLPEPRKFLDRLAELVVPGGELVLATPCTWLEEFTARENWPPGSTLDFLKGELGTDFELIRQADEPFLIRETARKFQWTISLVTVWKRRI